MLKLLNTQCTSAYLGLGLWGSSTSEPLRVAALFLLVALKIYFIKKYKRIYHELTLSWGSLGLSLPFWLRAQVHHHLAHHYII
jgi:hypothetical protein